MKLRLTVLITICFLINSSFGQVKLTEGRVLFETNLLSLPQYALDSEIFVIGEKGKLGVYHSSHGLMVPLEFDDVKICKHFDYSNTFPDLDFLFFIVRKGKHYGLYKFEKESSVVLKVQYDSIIYDSRRLYQNFIVLNSKKQQIFHPIAEKFSSNSDLIPNQKNLGEKDASASRFIKENDLKEEQPYWVEMNIEKLNEKFKCRNFKIFQSSTNFGVKRISDGSIVIKSNFKTVSFIDSNGGRFECWNSNQFALYDTFGHLLLSGSIIPGYIFGIANNFHVIKSNGKYGLFSKSDGWHMDAIYEDYRFSLNLKHLMLKLNGEFAFFEMNKRELSKVKFKDVISDCGNRFILVKLNSDTVLFDKDEGKVVKLRKFKFVQTDKYHWATFRYKNKYKLVSLKTNSIQKINAENLFLIKTYSKSSTLHYRRFCYLAYTVMGKSGLMDSSGKIIVEANYDSINYRHDFSDEIKSGFLLWRSKGQSQFLDVYYINSGKWIRDIEGIYNFHKGLQPQPFDKSQFNYGCIIKIKGLYQMFYFSEAKLKKPWQIDSLLARFEGKWIISQNDSLSLWDLNKDTVYKGFTDYLSMKFSHGDIVFLKKNASYVNAFGERRMYDLPAFKEAEPYDTLQSIYLLRNSNKIALFRPSLLFPDFSFLSDFIYDDVKIGKNELIWVKINGKWQIVKFNT